MFSQGKGERDEEETKMNSQPHSFRVCFDYKFIFFVGFTISPFPFSLAA